MIESRGIDSDRMIIMPVDTIEEFRTQAIRIVDKYLEQPKDERQPLMFVLDSLGMLSSSKEMEDINDKQVRTDEITAIKGASSLDFETRQANIPMLVTNHTYDVIGSYVPTKEMGGGVGLKYSASTIVFLSKKKEKKEPIWSETLLNVRRRSPVWPVRVLRWRHAYSLTSEDYNDTMDYLRWGSEQGCGKTLLDVMRLMERKFMPKQSSKIQNNISPPKFSKN